MHRLLILCILVSSCAEPADNNTSGINDTLTTENKTGAIDTPVVIYRNSQVVIKAKKSSYENDIPDVYVKFNPYISFADFKVDEVYRGEKAPLVLTKGNGFWDFRTRIRDGYKDSVCFAGKYCFVVWGCGSGCQMSAIIDATTGEVYKGPEATQGYDYKVDSRLVIVNPPRYEEYFEDDTTSAVPALWLNCGYCYPQVYIWNEEKKEFEERMAMY